MIKQTKKIALYFNILVLVSCTTPNKDINPNINQKNKNDNKSPFLTAPKVRKV